MSKIGALPLMVWLVAALGLVACGGGGGSADNGETSTVHLTFNPSTLVAKQLAGTPGQLQVTATADRDISGVINVGIIFDRSDLFDPNGVTLTQAGRTVTARLSIRSIATSGVYSGSIEVRLCRDAPQTCASPIPGSPWKLSYQVTVVVPNVDISPASLVQECYAAECPSVPLVVSAINPQTGSFNIPNYVVSAQDPAGVINVAGCVTNFVSASVVGQCSLIASIRNDVPVGIYTGTLNVTFAALSSQTSLPYSVTVRPASNLTPLARIPLASEWTQEQGNAQHTGYVPITLDTTKFTRRWLWPVINPNQPVNTAISLVTDSDRVFYSVVTLSSGDIDGGLLALSEQTGQTSTISSVAAWGVNSNLTTHGGHLIFTGQVPGSWQQSLYALNSTDDGTAFSYGLPVLMGTPTTNRSITVVDNKIYGEAGVFSALDGSSVSSGLPTTFQPFAMTNSFAYGFRPAELIGVPTNGGSSFSVSDQNLNGWEIPILGEQDNVIAFMTPNLEPSNNANFTTAVGHLKSYNLTTRATNWDVSAQGQSAYTPAVANGVIYFVNDNALEARSEVNGALLWSWTPAGGTLPSIRSNIVATNNMIFIGTPDSVYAIDVTTHQTVWSHSLLAIATSVSYTIGSGLAISPNGILYVGTYRGVIAFNLH